MGTHEHIRTARHWYPEGHAPPLSTLPSIIATVLVSLGAVAVLLLLLSSSDLPPWGLLPIVIGPLLGAALGSLVRRRTLSSKASGGLYFLQVRPVDEAGRRLGWWRFHWTLSMPGVIICRQRWSNEDQELTVRDIHEPIAVHLLRSLAIADGPVRVMRVETTAGAMEFRGRPEYLYELAAGAAPGDPSTGSTRM
jgi:hypothetical protein